MLEIIIPLRAITKDNSKIRNRVGLYFKESKYRVFEDNCAMFARTQYHDKPLEGPLTVHIDFYFRSKVHPDLFNLPKSVCDAMNGLLWADDKQIRNGYLNLIVDKNENERIIIRVEEN